MNRKELKQPDAFQKAGTQAGAWLIERQKMVLIAVMVALVGFGGVALASYISARGQTQAAHELGGALALLSREVAGPEKVAAPGEDPPFKTAQEKDEAVVKALGEFRAKFVDTQAAATAALPLAQGLMRQGKPDEAVRAFEEFLRTSTPDDPLRSSALEGKGYAHEAKGELDQALAAFDQLSRENDTEFLNGMGLYHRGRILILQNKKDEAAKQLSEIPAAAPNSAAARLATDRMAILAAEGVNVPPPQAPATDAGAATTP